MDTSLHKFRVLRRRRVAGGLLVLALCGADARSSWAQTLAERMPTCFACHGEHGTSTNPEVPSLGGQPAAYMEIQLYLFREKMRPPAVMNEAMQGISNDDLRVLAKLLANLPPPASTEAGNPARMQHAQALIHQ